MARRRKCAANHFLLKGICFRVGAQDKGSGGRGVKWAGERGLESGFFGLGNEWSGGMGVRRANRQLKEA